ncbi:hypothetical protein HPB52_021699 [Rhipicephalus sanguineus]|uniref:Uncharacterized protein n=1 Tax=Rhipicephalus sanguineus TaxID=34632 RepID=A0A9D4Q8G1_RHISA|nr:hypothetical protein HPB52_021699 [Rhipicephalus sanguineus]
MVIVSGALQQDVVDGLARWALHTRWVSAARKPEEAFSGAAASDALTKKERSRTSVEASPRKQTRRIPRCHPRNRVQRAHLTRNDEASHIADTREGEEIQQVLRRGPKFSVEPTLRPEEKIATARTVSKLPKEEERHR